MSEGNSIRIYTKILSNDNFLVLFYDAINIILHKTSIRKYLYLKVSRYNNFTYDIQAPKNPLVLTDPYYDYDYVDYVELPPQPERPPLLSGAAAAGRHQLHSPQPSLQPSPPLQEEEEYYDDNEDEDDDYYYDEYDDKPFKVQGERAL